MRREPDVLARAHLRGMCECEVFRTVRTRALARID